MTLIERLEAAETGSHALWCKECGRILLSQPRDDKWRRPGPMEMLRKGGDMCGGSLQSGTPQECIASLRAREAMKEGDIIEHGHVIERAATQKED